MTIPPAVPVKSRKKYDSTVARIAGNIASGVAISSWDTRGLLNDVNALIRIAQMSVALARAIVAETERTEP